MKAILSVSNKSGICDFARGLVDLGYEILSTGGTLAYLEKNHIKATDIASYTNQNEIFNGRVKTLHPKIFGGILYRRDNESDKATAREQNIDEISLVCVNLYPFKETTQRTQNLDEIIENIDIGGPSLIRAAAKNYKSVVIATNPLDYNDILNALKNNKNTLAFRQKLMMKAFEHTASYDGFIANYMNARFEDDFGAYHFIIGKKVFSTKYGENPHQKGALYEFENAWSSDFIALKGEASFNNILDLNAAFKIANLFENGICIIKHGNPCGFAINKDLKIAYLNALKCDSISAYGGVAAINGILDKNLAQEMGKTFFEAIIAREITQEALEIFESKKRVRIFKINHLPKDSLDFRHISGGFLLQDSDFILENEVRNAEQKSQKAANAREMLDLEIAYKIASLTKSNCVTFVKNSALVGIGMGLTSRIDAAKLAAQKANLMGIDLANSAMASEAFFPFRDSLDLAASFGVSAIIQPGGSIRDKEVIEAANEHNIALYFTGKRHFLH